jgi:hypothetical protein
LTPGRECIPFAVMAYLVLKDIHNILRWLVILTAFWALFRVWGGLLARRTWAAADRHAGLAFTSTLNLQLVLGLIVLFAGPTGAAFSNMGQAMKDPTTRFFAVEHPFLMILAVVVAQVGFSLAKRAATDRARFLKAAIPYTLATIFVLISIPWPFLKAGRPLFPSFLG